MGNGEWGMGNGEWGMGNGEQEPWSIFKDAPRGKWLKWGYVSIHPCLQPFSF